jgi:hypothetical protein
VTSDAAIAKPLPVLDLVGAAERSEDLDLAVDLGDHAADDRQSTRDDAQVLVDVVPSVFGDLGDGEVMGLAVSSGTFPTRWRECAGGSRRRRQGRG